MSHLIKIYAVCKFSCFHLWYLVQFHENSIHRLPMTQMADSKMIEEQ